MTVTISKITAPTIAVTGTYSINIATKQFKENLAGTSVRNLVVSNQTPRVASRTGHGLLVYGPEKNTGVHGRFFGTSPSGDPYISIPLFSPGTVITLGTVYPQATYSYATKATKPDFKGILNISNNTVNVNAQIYYTFDGTDPSRKTGKLYIGNLTLRKNKTSSNSTIIKARVYYKGKKSDVVAFSFRIAQ